MSNLYSKAVHSGKHLMLACVPNSALKAAITAQTAGIGTLVKFTGSANYEVGLCGAGDVANGRIAQLDVSLVTVEVFGYLDASNVWHNANGVIEVGYTGSPTLGAATLVGAGGVYVYKATSGGQGYILAIDVPVKNRLILLI